MVIFSTPQTSPPPSAEEKIFSENAVQEEWEISLKTWGIVLLGGMSKNEQIQFFLLTNVFASNLNTINLKLFLNHSGIYRFRKIFKKDSGEINLLGVHRNM